MRHGARMVALLGLLGVGVGLTFLLAAQSSVLARPIPRGPEPGPPAAVASLLDSERLALMDRMLIPSAPAQAIAAAAPRDAGRDELVLIAVVDLDLSGYGYFPGGGGIMTFTGPMVLQRAAPRKQGGGMAVIETEIVSMDLRGFSPVAGPIQISESPEQKSMGQMRLDGKQAVDSFFDVFFDVMPMGDQQNAPQMSHNEEPLRLEAMIRSIPPREDAYVSRKPVALFDVSGAEIGSLRIAHLIPADPSHVVLANKLGAIKQKLLRRTTEVPPPER